MPKLKRILKVFTILAIAVAIAISITVLAADQVISARSEKYIFDSTNDMPACETALVLGCAQYLNGRLNYFFKYRIDAAAELYRSGKIKYIVVSGDNSKVGYNEPLDMKKALVAEGVPSDVIFLDYAGFRTLDSVVRMREIFSQNRYIVVSQEFHNQRAIFISRRLDMETYGYNARDLNGRSGKSTHVREKFARLKAFWDLLVKKQPKFLGDKIDIESHKPNDL